VCDKILICGTHEIWKGATQLLKDYFDRISLADVVEITEKKQVAARKKARPK
jgi:DNA-binding IscR family transcriptional regulator